MQPLGRCQTEPASLWHSDKPGRRARAQQLCRGCPLVDACREWALHEWPLEPGVKVVVGGLTESQIASIRRELGITVTLPRRPSTARRHLLPVTSTDEEQARIERRRLSTAHGKGHHDARARAGCPRCD